MSAPERADAGALPVSPSMEPAARSAGIPAPALPADRRTVAVAAVAVAVGGAAALVARALTALIGLVTNAAFYGRLSPAFVSPAGNALGWRVVLVPAAGGLVVGAMARWGSRAIRGHGIPEAMEQSLLNEGRVPPRVTFLKPLSAAVAIGTGGPFGAEGPIIATGGALGSLVGQLLETTAAERRTLLAAGAAAGMSATFGSPVSAVLLAVELLLFELRPRSLVPVALASATAAGVRAALLGTAPIFPMPAVAAPPLAALTAYTVLGAAAGVLGVGVTRAVYRVEDAFEKLPVPWPLWPALGGLLVGAVGWAVPRTLGVGYDNIDGILSGGLLGTGLALLCGAKFLSWVVALGSGTSGGTLAPLFTFGGGVGALAGAALARSFPAAGVDPRLAALVGMAALFAGASRAALASVVFALEVTLQPAALPALLGGCAAAHLASCLLMRESIMTEKIARRGVRVPVEVTADYLDRVPVRKGCSAPVVTLAAGEPLARARERLREGPGVPSHNGFPVVDAAGRLVGVVTRRDLLDPARPGSEPVSAAVRRPPVVAFEDESLREAADRMVEEGIGRLPVVSRRAPDLVVGILTRSDLLAAHRARLDEGRRARRVLPLGRARRPAGAGDAAGR